MGFFSKLFGSHTDHELKKIYPIVDKIEALEPQMQALSDAELRAKTAEFRNRYDNGEDLDSMLPEAFAAVREAAWRVLGMKPFRVQLIGGIVLHQGRIAEMKTGEGKTLVAVMPAYLNAITGNGVNVLAMGAFYVAPQMGCDIADAYLNAELGTGYEWWKNFYEFHKLAIDELEAFNYEEYKKNGFKVNKLGDYDLTLEDKPE